MSEKTKLEMDMFDIVDLSNVLDEKIDFLIKDFSMVELHSLENIFPKTKKAYITLFLHKLQIRKVKFFPKTQVNVRKNFII